MCFVVCFVRGMFEFVGLSSGVARSSECLWAQDMAAMVTALHVVDNNAVDAMGGGGKPLAQPDPLLCGAG
jgi:hypothetical protein